MDLKSFHAEDISCTLCENRRGINSNCCCPEDAKDLVLITENKLRRRVGLEVHQKLCSAHAAKLRNGLLFGGSSVFDCCAPFHVNTARSPGLRPVPHSWKEYFPSPTHSDVRYRPRQRICWDCYAVALEVINAEQLDSSDEESASGVKSTPSCLGYVSPRRWASNLSLFPTSPHGSQFGSAWSLTPNVYSPKSPTPRGVQRRDKDYDNVGILRESVNAQRATSPTTSKEDIGDDSIQSPLSPSEVFTTTWSLDPNHNVTCVIDLSSNQSHSQMNSFEKEETPIRAPPDPKSSAEDVENFSPDPQSISSSKQESSSRKHDEGDSLANDEYVKESEEGNPFSSENLPKERNPTINHLLTSFPPPSYDNSYSHGDNEITPIKCGETSKDSEKLRAGGLLPSDKTTPDTHVPADEIPVTTTYLGKSEVANSHLHPLNPGVTSPPQEASPQVLITRPSLTIDQPSLHGNSAGNSIDNDAVDSGDISKMEREKEETMRLTAVVTSEKEIVDKIIDNQLTKTSSPILTEQRNWDENKIDFSSDQSLGPDWVLVESSQNESDLLSQSASSSLAVSSPTDKSTGDDNKPLLDCNNAKTDRVIGHDKIATENRDVVIPDESIGEDESFRFDPITAARSGDGCERVNDDPENMGRDTISESTQESANFGDLQSTLPIVVVVDDDVAKQTLLDATKQLSTDEVDDDPSEEYKHNHSNMVRSALNYETDDSSSCDEDFGLRPIVEESPDAVNNATSETNNSHSSSNSMEDIRPSSDLYTSCASATSKQKDLSNNIPYEMIDDALDHTNKNSLGEICLDGELPPVSYMYERRKVRLDQVTPDSGTSTTDGENDAPSQTAVTSSNQDELITAAKTDLYKHLHGSKDSAASSSASDQECEPAGSEGHVSNPALLADTIADDSDTKNAELQSINRPCEYEDVQLRRRRTNSRSHSVDVDSSSVDKQSLPLRPSIRSDGIISKRKNAWKDKKRKFGVSFALPILEGETPGMNQGERTQNIPLERASTEIVESRPDSGMLDGGAGLEDEVSKRPKTLRESRRIPNKDRLSSLQKLEDTDADRGNKPDQSEDEDVSAILSDIISNVFTTRTLTDWTKSFSESSMPMIIFAGVSITAALSLSFIAYLAFR